MATPTTKGIDLNWKIGGVGGFGLQASGALFAKVMRRTGFYVFVTHEYPNIIKGGHAATEVRVSDKPLTSHRDGVDILVALDADTITRHAGEMRSGSVLLYDTETVEPAPTLTDKTVQVIGIPFVKIARETAGMDLARNTVAIGASLGLIECGRIDHFLDVLGLVFERKGAEIVEANRKAAQAGYDHVEAQHGHTFACAVPQGDPPDTILVNGNEAMSLGALAAGCQFVAMYPMTPTSSILHYMAARQKDYPVVVKHTEDEIAAMNAVAGASYAGVRAMTATSGGGFALMTEALGMIGIMELPMVCVMGMRVGPSTGMPTWTEQGELRMVLHASQGEFPRIVLAPGDVEEAFLLTAEAFNWADQFQCPVLLFTDKHLSDLSNTVKPFDVHPITMNRGPLLTARGIPQDKQFARYAITEDGISPRSIPGQAGGEHISTSYEHDEWGYYTESGKVHVEQTDKRMRKLERALDVLPVPTLAGPKKADVTFIAWGSNKGNVLEAMEMLAAKGVSANFVHVALLAPFPTVALTKILQAATTTINVENNATGQFAGLMREHTGIAPTYNMLKYDAKAFSPQEIVDKTLAFLKK
jgi:2-oxoglutarate ferredoxin oxidoreductase subunit alpha